MGPEALKRRLVPGSKVLGSGFSPERGFRFQCSGQKDDVRYQCSGFRREGVLDFHPAFSDTRHQTTKVFQFRIKDSRRFQVSAAMLFLLTPGIPNCSTPDPRRFQVQLAPFEKRSGDGIFYH